jgi:hypothetical protein
VRCSHKNKKNYQFSGLGCLRKNFINIYIWFEKTSTLSLLAWMCVCVCVCVCKQLQRLIRIPRYLEPKVEWTGGDGDLHRDISAWGVNTKWFPSVVSVPHRRGMGRGTYGTLIHSGKKSWAQLSMAQCKLTTVELIDALQRCTEKKDWDRLLFYLGSRLTHRPGEAGVYSTLPLAQMAVAYYNRQMVSY